MHVVHKQGDIEGSKEALIDAQLTRNKSMLYVVPIKQYITSHGPESLTVGSSLQIQLVGKLGNIRGPGLHHLHKVAQEGLLSVSCTRVLQLRG